MSELERLIQELCPDGVVYQQLGDVVDSLKKGTLKTTDLIEDGIYPVINSGRTFYGKYNDYNNDGNAITFASRGENAGYVNYIDEKFWAGGLCYPYRTKANSNLDTKFLYYFLKEKEEYIRKVLVDDGGIPALNKSTIEKLNVPIPPMKVQSEIVRILDHFTLLTAELTAELTARKQQYDYYRNSILSFDNKVEEYVLGDIALVTKLAGFEFSEYMIYSNNGEIIALRGLNVKNGHLDLSDVKYIDNSNLSKLTRSKLVVGDMLFTYVGTVGQVAVIEENDKYYLAPNVALIRCNPDVILPKYMSYYFRSKEFWNSQIERLLQNSSMKNVPMEKIRQFKLFVPSLEEQQRIVDILDKFDTYCSDITQGLPAEIELRQQQYEYYRDKLLTFKELK